MMMGMGLVRRVLRGGGGRRGGGLRVRAFLTGGGLYSICLIGSGVRVYDTDREVLG